MPTTDQQRYQMIERALLRQQGAPGVVNLLLWERLATELSLIIGAHGFDALYLRSLHCARESFPWLPHCGEHAPGEAFRPIAVSLNTHAPEEARLATVALLDIFTETLGILIGELLTNNVLRQAWGDDTPTIARTEVQS